MAAKVQWYRGAWWVMTHANGRRVRRRYGPAKKDQRQAERDAAIVNADLTRAKLAGVTFDPPRRDGARSEQAEVTAPTFREFVPRYLESQEVADLSPSSRRGLTSYLREDGPLMPFLGAHRLDEISVRVLRDWWAAEVIERGRRAEERNRELAARGAPVRGSRRRGFCAQTGRKYLDAVGAILGYAVKLGVLDSTPVPAFRMQLRRGARTKKGRAEAVPDRHVQPIESPAELRRLVEAADAHAAAEFARTHEVQQGQPTRRALTLEERSSGVRDCLAVLLMLDAGLRLGEVVALTWGQVRWGSAPDDPTRALYIDRNRPSGLRREERDEDPKSGRARTVALSRRLRTALAELHRLQYRPGPERRVLPGFDGSNFRDRGWRKILERAGLGYRPPKDLRDTYASWLLSLGVQLGYISRQLGHADVEVTARHYARWCGGDVYREAMRLEPGDVPADLLARVVEEAETAPGRPWTAPLPTDPGAELVTPRKVERETGLEPATLSLGS